jgi:hypothetical protein
MLMSRVFGLLYIMNLLLGIGLVSVSLGAFSTLVNSLETSSLCLNDILTFLLIINTFDWAWLVFDLGDLVVLVSIDELIAI